MSDHPDNAAEPRSNPEGPIDVIRDPILGPPGRGKSWSPRVVLLGDFCITADTAAPRHGVIGDAKTLNDGQR